MKVNYIIILLILSILLSACANSKETKGEIEPEEAGNNNGEQHLVMEIPAVNREDLIQTLRSWKKEELKNLDGGHFIARDGFDGPGEDGEVVQQIAGEDVSEAAASLESYVADMETDDTWTLHLNSVERTEEELIDVLDRFREEGGNWYEDGAFIGGSVNIPSNTVEVRVTSTEKVNEAKVEADLGSTDFLTWQESSSARRGPDGLPKEAPDREGTVTDIDGKGRPLISDELYITVTDAAVFKNKEQIPPEEIKVGDKVRVWTTGEVAESMPAQGEALVVEIMTEEVTED